MGRSVKSAVNLRPLPLVGICLAFGSLAMGCGEGSKATNVVLSEGDACGDAFFWAVSESGDTAVTIALEARERSGQEPTKIDISLPDPAVEATVLSGHDLARNFCTDVLDTRSEPQDRQPAVAGSGSVTLDAVPDGPDSLACGTVNGELDFQGVVAEDGTTFTPITVRSASIGCYSG